MKNKIFYGFFSILCIFLLTGCKDKKEESEPKTLVESILKRKNLESSPYIKLTNGNILNSDSSFAKYTFITNNSIYIFDPEKLDKGVFEYRKVFDIPSSIKVMTIDTSYGSDISFIDYNDTKYTLVDENTDNNVIDSYSMFEKAIYNKLNNNLKWEYSKTFLGKKMNYDFVSVYAIYKDNKLYRLNYGNEKYPVLDEIEIKDKNEKVIRIYNDRIVKTDKNFYELMSYFDTNQNKTVTMLVKIKSLFL